MVLKNLQNKGNLSWPSLHKVQTPTVSKSRRHCRLSKVNIVSISETTTPFLQLEVDMRSTKLKCTTVILYINVLGLINPFLLKKKKKT